MISQWVPSLHSEMQLHRWQKNCFTLKRTLKITVRRDNEPIQTQWHLYCRIPHFHLSRRRVSTCLSNRLENVEESSRFKIFLPLKKWIAREQSLKAKRIRNQKCSPISSNRFNKSIMSTCTMLNPMSWRPLERKITRISIIMMNSHNFRETIG